MFYDDIISVKLPHPAAALENGTKHELWGIRGLLKEERRPCLNYKHIWAGDMSVLYFCVCVLCVRVWIRAQPGCVASCWFKKTKQKKKHLCGSRTINPRKKSPCEPVFWLKATLKSKKMSITCAAMTIKQLQRIRISTYWQWHAPLW